MQARTETRSNVIVPPFNFLEHAFGELICEIEARRPLTGELNMESREPQMESN